MRKELGVRDLVGTFVSIASPTVVELLGGCGFDLLCLDSEHAPFDPSRTEELIRAADAVGCPVIVRVPAAGPEIGRALDSGAAGVLVPKVETAAQAAEVIAAVRYPPEGSRGAGPGRATGYGARFAGYLAAANDQIAAIVQVETRTAVKNVDEILAVPGVDMVFVGPGDLAVSLGASMGSEEHTAAIQTVAEAAKRANVPLGIFCMTPGGVAQWRGQGASLFLLAGDLAMLADTGSRLAAQGRPTSGGADK